MSVPETPAEERLATRARLYAEHPENNVAWRELLKAARELTDAEPEPAEEQVIFAGQYTKLRSGGWGMRVFGVAHVGALVDVETRAGEIRREVVERVIWSGVLRGRTVSLCTISRGEATP
jgi:hypothetical protein